MFLPCDLECDCYSKNTWKRKASQKSFLYSQTSQIHGQQLVNNAVARVCFRCKVQLITVMGDMLSQDSHKQEQ